MQNMTPLGEACRLDKIGKIVALKEKKSEYRFEPKTEKQVTVYQVDNCLLGEGVKKCDFLLLNFSDNQAYFIELKNGDLGTALEQLVSTLRLLLKRLQKNMPGVKVNCRIVLSNIKKQEDALRTEAYKDLGVMMKSFGGTLERSTKGTFTERIP